MTTSKFKRYGIPTALVVGGVTVGGLLSPIGLASAQESDSDEPTTDAESTDGADASESDSDAADEGRKGRRGLRKEAVSEALGLSPEEIRQGFADGKSLADMAAEQGIDVADLEASLAAAANEALDQAVENGRLTAEEADEKRAQIDERVSELVNRDPSEFEGRKGHRGHRGPRFGAGEEISELLGLSQEEIRSALADGSSLADLAEQQGVSVDDVAATLTAGMEERLDQAVENGRIDQERADEIEARFEDNLDDLINGEFTHSHEHGHGPGRGGFGHHRRGGAPDAGGTDGGDVEGASLSA